MKLYCEICKKVIKQKDIVIEKGLNYHYDCWKKKREVGKNEKDLG